MKKIVGILSAAAVLATSVFALDISAMIQLDAELANFGKDTVQLFKVKPWDPEGGSDYVWRFDVAGDQAGATVYNFSPDKKDDVEHHIDYARVSEWSIWLKPIDVLKITVGNIVYESMGPRFGWWAKTVRNAKYGFQCDLDFGPLQITAGLGGAYKGLWDSGTGMNTYWFDKDYVGLRKLGQFWGGGSYNVDGIGTFGASVNRGAQVNPHGFAQTQAWASTPLAFEVYYANMPWGETSWFADLALVMKEKNPYGGAEEDFGLELDRLTGQFYFEWHLDAFTLYVVDVAEINFDSDAVDAGTIKLFKDGFELKASYALDSITPYVQIDGYGIMDSALGVRLGVGFNIGACVIDAAVQTDLNWVSDFGVGVKVPVQFTLNF